MLRCVAPQHMKTKSSLDAANSSTHTIRIPTPLKQAFDEMADMHVRNGSQLVREFMRDYGLHNPSAANRLAARIIEPVNRLQIHPKLGKPSWAEGTRELMIPKFPHSTVYKENQGDCMVLRVPHQTVQWPVEASQDN